MTLDTKIQALKTWFKDNSPIALAYSGGVDSSFLIAVGREAIGAGLLPITVRSAFYPKREAREAEALAAQLDAGILWLEAAPLESPTIAVNPENRCYLCKLEIFTSIIAAAKERGITTVIDGTNLDDLADYRPGAKALAELGVQSPLRDLGFTKEEIRQASRTLGLEGWAKPAYACLASRIPYGEPITADKLASIEKAEDALLELGFTQVRVRHHGPVARIEVSEADIAAFLGPELRQTVTARIREAGFQYVALDLAGYRTGSLNEMVRNSLSP